MIEGVNFIAIFVFFVNDAKINPRELKPESSSMVVWGVKKAISYSEHHLFK